MAKLHLQQALSNQLCAGGKKTVRFFTLPNTRYELETPFSNCYKSGVPTSNFKDVYVVKGQVNFLKPTVKTNSFVGAFAKIAKSDS